jgi:hypothetical protein
MTKLLFCLSAILALCLSLAPAAPAPTAATTLILRAHWDTGAAIVGNVTLIEAGVNGNPDQLLAVRKLSSTGTATFADPAALDANAVFNVNLNFTDLNGVGWQVSFPFSTLGIDPTKITRGEVDLVIHSADDSLATAALKVNFAL